MKDTVLALALLGVWVFGSSCSDDASGESPAEEDLGFADLREMAEDRCKQAARCQATPVGVALAECVDNKLGSYLADSECIAAYYLDQCLLDMTCEDIDILFNYFQGDCREELGEYDRVSSCLSP